MFLLRRTAARALTSSPSKAIFAKPRSVTTRASFGLRSTQPQWSTSLFQRRFASDEATKAAETAKEEVSSGESSSGASSESFAQTVTEAPADESVTPAPQASQADPTDASATVGIEALNSAVDKSDKTASPGTTAASTKTLYVGNLYYEVTQDQIQRVFSRFGPIDNVKLIFDNRGLSRGFAYVEYQNIADAQAAVENLDMQVFEGRNLVVQFHRPRPAKRAFGEQSQNPPSKTLFIGNMSFEMSDKDLNDLFREIRNVMDVRVAIDRRTGQPRGFAHADFIDVASATKAREVLKEKTIYGRQLRVDFSKSTNDRPRTDRVARDNQTPRQ